MVKQTKPKGKTKELSVEELMALDDSEDQSVVTGGDFEKNLPPEGETLARFVEYIELGLQPQRPYMGQPKEPAEEVSLGFELLSPDNIREVEVNGETKVFTDRVYMTVAKKLSGRAKFRKIFDAMKYGRDDLKNMKRMLGEAFIVTITHGKSSDPKNTKVYVNIGNKDNVGIRGPFTMNLKTRKSTKEDVPEPTMPLKIFLWEHPTKASWDSLFIDGEYEKDGKKFSKNFIQNKILKSPSFEGSPLESLLEGTGNLPPLEEDSIDDIGVEDEQPKVNASGRNIRSVQSTQKTKGKVAKSRSKKLDTSMLTKPSAKVESKPTLKAKPVLKRPSTKDAFKALGLNVK